MFYLVHLIILLVTQLNHLASSQLTYLLLLPGIFSYNKTSVKLSKVLNLFMIMVFWGLILSLLSIFFLLPEKVTLIVLKEVVEQCLTQWFVLIYIILYLLIPVLNMIINQISRPSLEKIIIINLFFF